MDDLVFEGWEPKVHLRNDFSCGNKSLDDFLHHKVSQYEKRNLGRTFVAVRKLEKKVLGYYTLAASSISYSEFPSASAKKLPKHPVPVALLGRLAVDRSMQRQGLGSSLLIDALKRALILSSGMGIHAIKVEAIDETAKRFYEKNGFIPLSESPMKLFLPLETIRKAFQTS